MRRQRKIQSGFLGFEGSLHHPEALYKAWRSSCVVPGAWENWCDYRRQVTDYVVENSMPGTSLAIFGAGRCNDLELTRLLGHFSKVTLLDMDEGAMAKAVKQCGVLGKEPRLVLFPVDFVGICPADYIRFAGALLRCARRGRWEESGSEPAPTPSDMLQAMYVKSHRHTVTFPHAPYDYAIALGVHSQLGNLPAWLLRAVEAGMSEENAMGWQLEREELLCLIQKETTFLSERLTEWILSSTKIKAFLGCEQSRAHFSCGEWYAVPDSAVTGAWQAIRHVERLAAAGCVRFENYLDIVWPFCLAEKKAYRMMVMEVGNVER